MGNIYDLGVTPFYNGYYIHEHQKNIGRSISNYKDNEQGISSSDLVKKYNDLKDDAKKAVFNQYQQLIAAHFFKDVDDSTLSLLSETFKDNNNLDKINKAIKDELQQQLNTEVAKEIIKQENAIDWDSIVASINKLVTNPKSQNDLEVINEMFECLSQAVSLMGGKYGSQIAKVLIHLKNTENISLNNMGEELLEELIKIEQTLYKQENQGKFKSVQAQQIAPILTKLKKLGRFFSLREGGPKGEKGFWQNDNKQSLTGEYIKQFLQKEVFSTALGEAVGGALNKSANDTAKETILEIKNSLNSMKGNVGDTQVSLDYTDPQGKYTGVSGLRRQGKADVQLNNIGLNIGYILGNDMGTINISFGISNKTYKNIGFKEDGTLESGFAKGGSIKLPLVISMLTSSLDLQYLIYNTYAWTSSSAPKSGKAMINKKDLIQPLIAMQDALFTRAIIYLFGSRGKQDFANFLMVNGKLVSLWEIIKEVINQTQLSSSMNISNEQALNFHVTGHKDFGKYLGIRKKISMYQRIVETNNMIEQSRIEGKIDITKLKTD